MKHLLASIVLIGLCAVLLASCLRPSDPPDSLHLTEEERSLLDASPDNIVFKVFYGVYVSHFAEKKNIQAITEDARAVYWVLDSDGTYIKQRECVNGEMVGGGPLPTVWCDWYTYVVSPGTVFDPSVKVRAVYGLDALMSYQGAYIYYDTDHGDYVLYKMYEGDEEWYLFPASDFFELSAEVHEQQKINSDSLGIIMFDVVCDLNSYAWNPEHLFKP